MNQITQNGLIINAIGLQHKITPSQLSNLHTVAIKKRLAVVRLKAANVVPKLRARNRVRQNNGPTTKFATDSIVHTWKTLRSISILKTLYSNQSSAWLRDVIYVRDRLTNTADNPHLPTSPPSPNLPLTTQFRCANVRSGGYKLYFVTDECSSKIFVQLSIPVSWRT